MISQSFPIVDSFYDWLENLDEHQTIVASGSLIFISREGVYKSGCADLNDGIWCYTTTLGSPNRYICIYIFDDGKRYFPLHGVVTSHVDIRGENLREARQTMGLR
jgi:hypothetical protein